MSLVMSSLVRRYGVKVADSLWSISHYMVEGRPPVREIGSSSQSNDYKMHTCHFQALCLALIKIK